MVRAPSAVYFISFEHVFSVVDMVDYLSEATTVEVL